MPRRSDEAMMRPDQKESISGREGVQTNQAIERIYGNGGGANPLVAVTTLPPGTTVDSPRVRAQLRSAFDRIAAPLPEARVVSYLSTGDRSFVSADRRTTFALIEPKTAPGGGGEGGERINSGELSAARARRRQAEW
jgi:RND superfamily putative drug exporter